MYTLTLILILTVTMATTQGNNNNNDDDLVNFLKLKAHKEHRYYIDVISDDDTDELKAALENVTLEHSYKVVGEPRYMFLFRSNKTDALRDLAFPSGSRAVQFPVEHGEEFFEMFDVDLGTWNVSESSSSGNLFFTQWIMDMPKDECPGQFAMEVKTYVENMKESFGTFKNVVRPAIATYPPKIFFFTEMDENASQNMGRVSLNVFGGYGNRNLLTKRIVTI